MIDPQKERADKAKALKRLIRKWLTVQDTKEKAHIVIARNPHIGRSARPRKLPGT